MLRESLMKLWVSKLLMCLILFSLSSCNTTDQKTFGEVKIGGQAPGFSLKSIEGKTVKSDSFKGDITVLNFWATWCAPCRKEIPELKELAANSEVKVVGIALDKEGASVVKPFVEKHGLNYTILLGNEEVFSRFKGFSIPYTLVLDDKQQIVNIYRGLATKKSLEQDFEKIHRGDG
jgi:thiol-disulfide isomerase/thioredoxin